MLSSLLTRWSNMQQEFPVTSRCREPTFYSCTFGDTTSAAVMPQIAASTYLLASRNANSDARSKSGRETSIVVRMSSPQILQRAACGHTRVLNRSSLGNEKATIGISTCNVELVIVHNFSLRCRHEVCSRSTIVVMRLLFS